MSASMTVPISARVPGGLAFKILTLGDSSVGKTSLTYRFVADQFTTSVLPTVGLELQEKRIASYRQQRISLKIWDTAGQERFLTLSSVYYRGAHGVLLVYSVVDRNTFSRINSWIGNIDRYCTDSEPPAMILVGNKADLRPVPSSARGLPANCISREEGRQLADFYGMPFFETSCKDGLGVQEAFYALLDVLLDSMSVPSSRDSSPLPAISTAPQCCSGKPPDTARPPRPKPPAPSIQQVSD